MSKITKLVAITASVTLLSATMAFADAVQAQGSPSPAFQAAQAVAVPEPASLFLLGSGLIPILFLRRRRSA